MNKINKNIVLGFALFLMGAYFVSGIYGLRVIAIMIFFAFPFYIIIGLFNSSVFENVTYSLFFSFAFMTYVIYWVNLYFIPSYRTSIIVAYVILIGSYFVIKKMKGKNDS